jgi:hypothetical protein
VLTVAGGGTSVAASGLGRATNRAVVVAHRYTIEALVTVEVTRTPDPGFSHEMHATWSFMGESNQEVWLVRSGAVAFPYYTMTSPGQLTNPLYLTVRGLLWVNGSWLEDTNACWHGDLRSAGDQSATAEVLLNRNRVTFSLAVDDPNRYQVVESLPGCQPSNKFVVSLTHFQIGENVAYGSEGKGSPHDGLSPANNSRAALPTSESYLTLQEVRAIRFGNDFRIPKTVGPSDDRSLHRTYLIGDWTPEATEEWDYTLVVHFTLAP